MAENIVIKEILYNPFSVRPLRDKLKIVNIGQPIPPLPNFIIKLRENDMQHIFASLVLKRLTG
jgi:hypothetical protein